MTCPFSSLERERLLVRHARCMRPFSSAQSERIMPTLLPLIKSFRQGRKGGREETLGGRLMPAAAATNLVMQKEGRALPSFPSSVSNLFKAFRFLPPTDGRRTKGRTILLLLLFSSSPVVGSEKTEGREGARVSVGVAPPPFSSSPGHNKWVYSVGQLRWGLFPD